MPKHKNPVISKKPNIFISILKNFFWNKKFFYISIFLLVLFIPWVPVLYFGAIIYFPYDETGKGRYMRITGPLVQYVGGEWVGSSQIPSACKKALVIAEDSEFYNHSGISFESIKSSFEYNRKQGRIISGASTISQQFIKNAFLSRNKTYVRKIREALGSILFNFLFSKDQQLTWYFNVVEFGPRVYGLTSAAKYYFKKNANSLDTRECITLVSFLPRPILFGNSYKKGIPPRAFLSRFQRIYSGIMPTPVKKEISPPKKEEIEEETE
ncbi:MAG: transglycosylase domain-containing protein [Leptospiraceae bacterium]|nr:transglycosylase domain-containing protein [Leptospiraceae bacterium]